MKSKDNSLEEYLITKNEDKKKSGQVYPLGYKDKRDVKRRKNRKSKNSSKSGSSESIEEKDEELEDENLEFINKKNNSDPEKNNEILMKDNFKLFPLDEDSDSEIVEEEIITEDIIAKIYGDKTDDILLEKNNINLTSDITPISETMIVNTNKMKEEDKLNNSDEKNIMIKLKKRRILKFKDNILFKYFNHKSLIAKMRIITLIILLTYIILLNINIFIYVFSNTKLTIFCFEFIKSEELSEENTHTEKYYHKLFLSDRNSFFIIQILCGVPFISIIYSLLKNEYLPLKQFFKQTSFYFPLSLALNIPIIILSIINDEYENEDGTISIVLPIIFTLLTFIGFLSMSFILLGSKHLKYKSISSFINIGILCSFLTAFQCYCFFYNICLIIRAIYKKEMFIPEIVMGVIYFLIGIFIIVSFRDIFYVIIVVIIELGLLYIKKNIAVTIINLATTFFSFAAVIINIFKYKKKVFGLTRFD